MADDEPISEGSDDDPEAAGDAYERRLDEAEADVPAVERELDKYEAD